MDAQPLNDIETRAFRSLVVISQIAFPEIERTFRRAGLNGAEFGILTFLSDDPTGTVSAGEIAELTGLSASRVSHRLKSLEERGLLTRASSTMDGRVVEVTITDAGRRLRADLSGPHNQDVRNLIFGRLEPDELEVLAESLYKIASGFTTHRFLKDFS